jgi:hypothetical protein
VRAFVPERIAGFEPIEHLLGTGVANYAGLDEGLTQYDSSFALGVYYQAGLFGLVLLLLTLRATWRCHGVGAAAMLLMLLATKLSLLAPAVWAICALLHGDTGRLRQSSRGRCASARDNRLAARAPHHAHRPHHHRARHRRRGNRAAAPDP